MARALPAQATIATHAAGDGRSRRQRPARKVPITGFAACRLRGRGIDRVAADAAASAREGAVPRRHVHARAGACARTSEGARALVLCAGGGIGDSLVASVVGRALHQRFARVDALTLPGHRQALERVPDFDGVLSDDGGDVDALIARIAERGYDAAIVTWATARIARIARGARIPVRIGQARRLYSGRLRKPSSCAASAEM